jgi:hypothetical protein
MNVQQRRCDQIENLLRTPDDVYKLRDEDFIWQAFKDDPVLQLIMATRVNDQVPPNVVSSIAASFGVSEDRIGSGTSAQQIRQIHTEAALFATRYILTWTEQFVQSAGKKLNGDPLVRRRKHCQ